LYWGGAGPLWFSPDRIEASTLAQIEPDKIVIDKVHSEANCSLRRPGTLLSLGIVMGAYRRCCKHSHHRSFPSRVSSLVAVHRYYGIVNRGGGSPANHCNGQFRADGK